MEQLLSRKGKQKPRYAKSFPGKLQGKVPGKKDGSFRGKLRTIFQGKRAGSDS